MTDTNPSEYDQMRELMKNPTVAKLAEKLQELKTAATEKGRDWEAVKDDLDARMNARPASSVFDTIDQMAAEIRDAQA